MGWESGTVGLSPGPGLAWSGVGWPRPCMVCWVLLSGWSRDAFLPRCQLQAHSCWKFLRVGSPHGPAVSTAPSE